jgi:hypothetical protein
VFNGFALEALTAIIACNPFWWPDAATQLDVSRSDVASMVTIRIVGPAVVFDFKNEDEPAVVEDESLLKTLHGLEHDEVFSDYLGDGGDRTLVDVGVSGGLLRFEYDAATKQLYGVTEYIAPRLLTPAEVAVLKEYTIGQWSDGIGSNFFQDRMCQRGDTRHGRLGVDCCVACGEAIALRQ